jgi:hypothetical protein
LLDPASNYGSSLSQPVGISHQHLGQMVFEDLKLNEFIYRMCTNKRKSTKTEPWGTPPLIREENEKEE